MNRLNELLPYLTFSNICRVLTIFGFIYFVVKCFIMKQAPVPKAAFKQVPHELLESCVDQLVKKEKEPFAPYTPPKELLQSLQQDREDEEALKELLCDICEHLGMDGSYIKLVIQHSPVTDRAGEIETDLAFTTIRLEIQKTYQVDTLVAVLAHEATHLKLYYRGVRRKDSWENEILTDTAAVFYGFYDVMYRGYEVRQGENAFSYHKVGYISQQDIKFIGELLDKISQKRYT